VSERANERSKRTGGGQKGIFRAESSIPVLIFCNGRLRMLRGRTIGSGNFSDFLLLRVRSKERTRKVDDSLKLCEQGAEKARCVSVSRTSAPPIAARVARALPDQVSMKSKAQGVTRRCYFCVAGKRPPLGQQPAAMDSIFTLPSAKDLSHVEPLPREKGGAPSAASHPHEQPSLMFGRKMGNNQPV